MIKKLSFNFTKEAKKQAERNPIRYPIVGPVK